MYLWWPLKQSQLDHACKEAEVRHHLNLRRWTLPKQIDALFIYSPDAFLLPSEIHPLRLQTYLPQYIFFWANNYKQNMKGTGDTKKKNTVLLGEQWQMEC